MNKKEVLEIRRQFSPENCAITRICGCYVDHEKEKKMEMKKAFLSLPEEEAFKYFDIFKHTLSGTIGKNLINMEFPLDQELNGGTQEFLMRLKDSKLQDDLLLEEFYGQLKEVPVKVGDYVEAKSVLGYVSQPTKYYSKEGCNVYFEMRKNGQPVNPVEYTADQD